VVTPQLMRRAVRLRCVVGTLSVLIAACGSSQRGERVASGPSVTRLPLAQLGSNGPELKRSALAVSPFGHVAFTTGYTEGDELITVVDSSGRVVSRLGPRGSGPGELQAAFVLFFQDSLLFAADVFQGRLHRYTIHGAYREYVQFPGSYIPVGYVRDSVDLSDHSSVTGPRIVRWALTANTGYRTLVQQNDSLFIDFATRGRGQMPPSLTIGSSFTGTVIGDGSTYQLFEYGKTGITEFGANRSPEILEPGFDADTAAYFGLYNLGPDGQGRLWVAGRSSGDGFLDVYQDHRWLRRFTIDCYVNSWYGLSINGDWLALLCDASEAADTEVQLQLYHIAG
jgi:hypothetical protein